MVLDASEKEVYNRMDAKRLIGGGFLDSLKSVVAKVAPVAKTIAPMLGPKGQMASDVLGALGFGKSGAGASGGGQAGAGRAGAGMAGGRLASRLM
jgi:hypothetical protein